MKLSKFQTHNTFKRWCEREHIRNRNLELIKEHRFFDIDSPQRIHKFLSRRGLAAALPEEMTSRKETGTLVEPAVTTKQYLNLERILGANDLVNIYFLEDALRISKTVGRIWVCDNIGVLRGYGNGFMVSPVLLLTNQHVLPDSATAGFSKIEFNFQLDDQHQLLPSHLFQLDPQSFYYSFEALDFALVAVKPINASGVSVSEFGYNRLSAEEGKAIISQWLNIIQHPSGMPKQVGLRGNQLIDVLDQFIHYKTDTAQGSSGSPVYNEQWEVVGLHHSGVWEEDAHGNIVALDGGAWNSSMGEDRIKWVANEGVRISSILRHLAEQHFPVPQAGLLSELFRAPAVPVPSKAGSMAQPVTVETSVMHAKTFVQANGKVSYTFPVSVSLGLKELLAAKSGDSIQLCVSTNNASDNVSITHQLSELLTLATNEFKKWKDVIAVRMGYVFKDGWITTDRALVVTVKKRKSLYELQKEGSSPLPDYFMGYPIEVSGPTIEELIAATEGQAALHRLINPLNILAAEILYVPPTNITLKTITKKMKVTAHVSPEEGWNNLKPFLAATQKSLTIAMYDFGARHILKTIESLRKKNTFENLTLTIQAGESVGQGTKANDLKDKEVLDDLEKVFKQQLHAAWIPTGSVNGWMASSYHIKVAIRDSSVLWLSSGNWQSSNQPELEKLEDVSPSYLIRNYNREWHVIIENEELAQTFETFIQHDYNYNKVERAQQEELLAGLNFLVPSVTFDFAEELAPAYESFKPYAENRVFTVTPLLTPDNFFEEVLELINCAKTELLIQNQTFNAPNPSQDKLEQLMLAILKKQQQGIDVKIIFRIIHAAAARKNLEKLVEMGFNKNSIRLQKNCHNKGIIVDKQKVLVGSQNFSNDGVSVNRDASLIFHDDKLAAYFRNIFLHDWHKVAQQHIGPEAYSIEIAKNNLLVPEGMERMTWSEIKEMM